MIDAVPPEMFTQLSTPQQVTVWEVVSSYAPPYSEAVEDWITVVRPHATLAMAEQHAEEAWQETVALVEEYALRCPRRLAGVAFDVELRTEDPERYQTLMNAVALRVRNAETAGWSEEFVRGAACRTPVVNMTADQVEQILGDPQKKNRTTTAYGTREQWVYPGRMYVYFEEGRVTAIQD